MRRILFLAAAIAALTGCDRFPADPEGTRGAVERRHVIRVGWATLPAGDRALAENFLTRLADATGAPPKTAARGPAEAMFALLEEGKLDLVMAEVADDSPWLTQVTVIEPLSHRRIGERRLGTSAVARNGENSWIMLLERESRNMRARP